MNILVTGATGFIGQHLVRRLVRQRHNVTALLRTESKRKYLPGGVEILQGDLSIFRDETLVLPPQDIVIHLAGAIFADSAAAYHEQNYEATRDLVQCIARQEWKPRRFLFASSLAAAGPSGDDNVLHEEDPPKPVDDYGKAKLAVEKFLASVTAFPTTSFRPAVVLGPGDENTLTLFKMARYRVGFTIDGKAQMLSFVDVDDLNDAILKMMEDPSTMHKVYFVAHPEIITNEDLFMGLGVVMRHRVFIVPLPGFLLRLATRASGAISGALGIKNQLDEKQYQQLTHHFMCSGDALARDLKWEPRRSLLTSLQKASDGYRSMGWL